MISQSTLTKARTIEKKHGTSYYLATLFFPKEIKEAVFILYAFVRIADEFVDNPLPDQDPETELQNWKVLWEEAYVTGKSSRDILSATATIFKTYNIPFELSIEFIDAMIQDLTKARYKDYGELKSYMRGSAEVIGLMLTYIMGYSDPKAFVYAAKLGEAMQLTNFLRDIKEDYEERGRIYIPEDDMASYLVTEDMIQNKVASQEFRHLMQFEISRARKLFREADLGICMLSHKSRFAVRLASHLYEKILDKIEEENYDIFKKRVRSTTLEKIWLISKTYVSH
ncbi:MAG: phytoene/squalene synthase family protein [Candidatus Zambryskibacteria bacterium]|nr:phytoene/squalene synthase family protein [Candidatus Zambryskibacteria bacterium]